MICSYDKGQGVSMYVCLCGGVTENQIKEQVELGAESIAELQKTLPIGLCCGTCDVVTEQFIKSFLSDAKDISYAA